MQNQTETLPTPSVDELARLLGGPSKRERDVLAKARDFAARAHDGQTRFSGEPHIHHALRTAENLARLGVDAETVAAGILHDVIEDTNVRREDIRDAFGENITALVEGTSKLGSLKYRGRERYAESLRHLFIATAEDVRVILIKLADRLDNVRTLRHVPKEKRRRIALETIEIYAAIAHRLGMGRLKTELLDEAFAFAYPAEYERVRALIRQRGTEREKYIEKVYKSIAKECAKEGIPDASISYRIKDYWSIYRKLLKKEMDVGKIYDLYAIRVIVPDIGSAYRVLGVIHGMWKPLPGRIKDYIANPKINGYQSLHTTVFTGDGGVAEIQIRTPEMHAEAEFGIAAHLLYKEGKAAERTGSDRMRWLSRIKELHEHSREDGEFVANLRLDFFEKSVFVFTPLGDVIELPEGATALDFAYHIHSEIGSRTAGAKVNGKFVSLNTPLKNSDIVEIQTKKTSRPTRKWLEYVHTSFARRYIRNQLNKRKTAKW